LAGGRDPSIVDAEFREAQSSGGVDLGRALAIGAMLGWGFEEFAAHGHDGGKIRGKLSDIVVGRKFEGIDEVECGGDGGGDEDSEWAKPGRKEGETKGENAANDEKYCGNRSQFSESDTE
jgi:hypothetical protein